MIDRQTILQELEQQGKQHLMDELCSASPSRSIWATTPSTCNSWG